MPIKHIGVLTGGGDAPGLNAVIRAVVKSAVNSGIAVTGLEDSFDGLIYPDKSRPLGLRDVTGILRLGGTILGTVNRGTPFLEPIVTPDGTFDYNDRVLDMCQKMGLDALVCIANARVQRGEMPPRSSFTPAFLLQFTLCGSQRVFAHLDFARRQLDEMAAQRITVLAL